MAFKLLCSALIAAPLLAWIFAEAEDAPSLLVLGLVLLVAGYHRNLLDGGERPPVGRIVLPTEEIMRVRYTIWGVPLAPARRVRHGVRMRERAAASPSRAWVVEALPAALRWLARKAGA